MCLAYVFAVIPKSQQREKRDKKSKLKGDAPKGFKKRKRHSSGHREKKKASCYENGVDPLTAPQEVFSPRTQEGVAAFKGVTLFSRYANDSLLCRQLSIFHTMKYGAPVVTDSMILCSYTQFYTCSTAKKVSDDAPALV